MVKFIKGWVWTGDNSKKYFINDTGSFPKDTEDYLVKIGVAVKEVDKKEK